MYANANANLLQKYQNDSIMTASPIDLIIMLYDALIKQIKLSEIFITEKKYDKANTHLMRAQDIVVELTRDLDFKYEVSDQLMQLYDYMISELVRTNRCKDTDSIPALIEIATELREAWVTVKATGGRQYVVEE